MSGSPAQPNLRLAERLLACSELAGVPIYLLNGSPIDEVCSLPEYCHRALRSSERESCLSFHDKLRERAQGQPGQPCLEICPLGVACFGWSSESLDISGGHTSITAHAELPVVSLARLEAVARRAGQLLEEDRLCASAPLNDLLTATLDQAARLGAVGASIQLLDGPQLLPIDQTRGRFSTRGSRVFVPIGRPNRVRGLLTLEFKGEPPIDGLDALAHQAGLAIENAQALVQEQQRSREATALYQAARAIEQAQELWDVLQRSCEALARLAEVNRCLILIRHPGRPFFTLEASMGLSDDQQEFFSAFRLPVNQLSEGNRLRLAEGKPILSEANPGECQGLARLFALLPSANALVVPLPSKDDLLGLVFLDDSRGNHHFSPASIRQVMTLALQVANAIQRASLIDQLQANLGPLKALYQVSTAITGTLSLTKVIRLIVDQAVELLEQSACGLLVLDEMGESFRLETSVGLPSGLLDPALQARMARHAVERKRAHSYYPGKDQDGEHGQEFDRALNAAGFGGVLSVPLIARKKMVGVLNCFTPPGIRFRQQEVRLLRGFANQAAVAVENARLHGLVRFKMGELGTLFEVSKAVTSTLQLDRVLQEIVRHVREILRADACSLMLLEGERLVHKTAEGMDPDVQREPVRLGSGPLGLAAKNRRPMLLLDREPHREEFPAAVRAEGMATVLSVPVETRGRVVGLINVYYREVTSLAPAQVNLLGTLGSQAAVAIENARLYAEKERVAELLRDVLIPRERLEFPGLAVGHRFIPSMDLSGDYYDLIPLGRHKCGLVMADVSGKGPDAAIQTVRAKHILKSYALAGYSPRKILSLLNHQVGQDPVTSRQVTVFYAEADLKTRRLRFASAGHEPPIFWSPHQERPRLLYAEGILIGAIPEATYEDCSVELPEGSWLILYTDGLTEARNEVGDFFGLQRVLELLHSHTGNSPQRLVNRIYDEVRRFSNSRLSDDFSVMAIRF
ncbi:GAF domain-containing protein [bacterium CPR1]|nr:GAF domain-containing protein [bacterium CPR1]